MANEQKPKLSFWTLFLMLPIALSFDGFVALAKLLDIIPAIGNFVSFTIGFMVSVVAYATFWFWFHRHGIRFLKSPKRLLTFPVAFFIKLLPFLGALPAWTAAVIFIFLNIRAEDLLAKTELGAKAVGAAAKVAGKIPGTGARFKQAAQNVSRDANEFAAEAKQTREQTQKAGQGQLGPNASPEERRYAQTMATLERRSLPSGQPRGGQGQENKEGATPGQAATTKAVGVDTPIRRRQERAAAEKANAEGRAYWAEQNKKEYEKKFGVNYDEQKKALHAGRPAPKRDIGGPPVFHKPSDSGAPKPPAETRKSAVTT